MNSLLNGGFPPLILKNINNKLNNNKERLISSNIKKNINIREILQTKINKNILDIKKENKDNLVIVTSL